jgi:hypothetical protein
MARQETLITRGGSIPLSSRHNIHWHQQKSLNCRHKVQVIVTSLSTVLHCVIHAESSLIWIHIKSDDVPGRWKIPHNEEMHTKFWLESMKRTDHSEDSGVDGKIVLE